MIYVVVPISVQTHLILSLFLDYFKNNIEICKEISAYIIKRH